MSLQELLHKSTSRVMTTDGVEASPGVELARHWNGDRCSFLLVNNTGTAQPIHEIVLFDISHDLPSESRLHGEGYNKISQTAGTLARPEDVDPVTDREHYKLPEPAGFRTVYGMMSVTVPDRHTWVLGFSSCRRFVGRFNINSERLQVVLIDLCIYKEAFHRVSPA